ncbi:MAG: ribonuclease Z [Candidatus Aenigmarchaeota archaeon]|nr:ribonuclease Z [Candidatus Aenigmarchaeota archaeon]MDI6721912.1 ribonuclease Z [Candidatus Aenigmarchaeota archaeon]
MTQIEVTFLGTTAGVPTKERSHPAVSIKYRSENEYNFLFDCGEGTQRQILHTDINFMRINDIFITHWHADHFAGLLGLFETMNLEGRTKALNIYGPEAQRFVDILQELGYSSKKYEIVAHDAWFEGISPQILLDNEEFQLLSIPVKHSIPAVAYAFAEKDRVKIDKTKSKAAGLPAKGPIYREIKEKGSVIWKEKKIKLEDIALVERGKKVVYSGDTMPCKNIITISKNADILIHDSTFFEDETDENYRHSNFDEVIRIAKEANAKQLVLTHISRRYQNAEDIKEKIKGYENVKIAKDLMKLVVR